MEAGVSVSEVYHLLGKEVGMMLEDVKTMSASHSAWGNRDHRNCQPSTFL